MKTVFLVEDEYPVRQGIKTCINWQAAGFILVGDADNGLSADEQIEKLEPDIIITDIKMPFMDGLTLCKKVLARTPSVKIIIISGYDEFKYAKKAISLGVSDYLLKPITEECLLDALKKVAGQIHVDVKFDAGELVALYNQGDVDRAKSFVDNLLDICDVDKTSVLKQTKTALFNFISTSTDYLVNLSIDIPDKLSITLQDIRKKIVAISSLDDAKEIFYQVFSEILKTREDALSNSAIYKCMKYIKNHYAEPDLSLKQVASQIHLNPSHLSASFSKTQGVSFSDYIINFRINKAKELLKTTNKKTSDIASCVGYNNPQYFCFAFKKNTGVTPSEFRKG